MTKPSPAPYTGATVTEKAKTIPPDDWQKALGFVRTRAEFASTSRSRFTLPELSSATFGRTDVNAFDRVRVILWLMLSSGIIEPDILPYYRSRRKEGTRHGAT